MTGTTHEWELPHDTTAPGEARALVRVELAGHARQDDAELIVSELVTNAVRHGAAPVLLRLLAAPATLRIEVLDAGTGHRGVDAAGRPADDSAGGRGLLLVAAIADAHGSGRVDQGWLVWAELGQSVASSSDS